MHQPFDPLILVDPALDFGKSRSRYVYGHRLPLPLQGELPAGMTLAGRTVATGTATAGPDLDEGGGDKWPHGAEFLQAPGLNPTDKGGVPGDTHNCIVPLRYSFVKQKAGARKYFLAGGG